MVSSLPCLFVTGLAKAVPPQFHFKNKEQNCRVPVSRNPAKIDRHCSSVVYSTTVTIFKALPSFSYRELVECEILPSLFCWPTCFSLELSKV